MAAPQIRQATDWILSGSRTTGLQGILAILLCHSMVQVSVTEASPLLRDGFVVWVTARCVHLLRRRCASCPIKLVYEYDWAGA
jgi:hypothetical protein